MRKSILVTALLFALSVAAYAIPAMPGTYRYTQPDGKTLVLQNHGDEYFHWTTNEQGDVVERDVDGFYRLSSFEQQKTKALSKASRIKGRHNILSRYDPCAWSSYEHPNSTNKGDRKILAILIQFTDSTFVVDDPGTKFYNMLNQAGYSYNGAIGSVRDYYVENSMNQYRPSFDVFGPITLSRSSKYYDDHGVYLAILEAYENYLYNQLNINDYDTDGDGAIDMVLVFYAGHNEAEGAGPESIWPHQSTGNMGNLGEKVLNRYFCTSELRGNSGHEICGIGTTCHEFGHSLGLPDFYDTNYETCGYTYYTTRSFDVMSSGGYNDNGRRPPYLNAVERNMLGWMPEGEEIISSGQVTINPIQSNAARVSRSKNEGEFFVYEYRNGQGWDSGLPWSGGEGLLIYHVDQSSRYIPAYGNTAWNLWTYTNSINAYTQYPCFVLTHSNDPVSALDDMTFPGSTGVTSFTPTDWDYDAGAISLNNISCNGSNVTFNAQRINTRWVCGRVSDQNTGEPIPDVQVLFPLLKSPKGDESTDGVPFTYTDNNGHYAFSYEGEETPKQLLTFRKDGYVPYSVEAAMENGYSSSNISLGKLGERDFDYLSKYSGSNTYKFYVDQPDCALAMRWTAEEVAERGLAGARISRIYFLSYLSYFTEAFVLVETDSRTLLRKKISDWFSSGWMGFDISGDDIRIPEGENVYIGFGFFGADQSSPISYITKTAERNGGGYYCHGFQNPNHVWRDCFASDAYNYSFWIEAEVQKMSVPDISEGNVSYIKEVDGTLTVVPATGRVVNTIRWFVDGAESPSAPNVSALGDGHSCTARISFKDGVTERVIYEF